MDIEFNKNEDSLKQLTFQLKSKLKKVYLGGGEKRIAKEHEKGKMTARERIAYLIDENSEFLEVGAFAGEGMYQDVAGAAGEENPIWQSPAHLRITLAIARSARLIHGGPSVVSVSCCAPLTRAGACGSDRPSRPLPASRPGRHR